LLVLEVIGPKGGHGDDMDVEATEGTPAVAAMPSRRPRTMCGASSAANSKTVPHCRVGKRRRHAVPAATDTARSSARKDFPHLGSPPIIPTA
jgi:hypothetical protein